MASRTYMEMWLKLCDAGKLPLSTGIYCALMQSVEYMNRHPEDIEHIVQNRVKFFKILSEVGFDILPQYAIILFEMEEVEALWNKYELRT